MNIETMLKDLQAKQHGNYYIVRCPECGHREAFIYIDDIIKHSTDPKHKIAIRCNRLSKCGKTSYIEDVNIDTIPEVKEDELRIGEVAREKLRILAFHPEFLLEYPQEWRGISQDTMKNHHIIYFHPEFPRFVKLCGDAFPDRFNQPCYAHRNIFIPILDYNGNVQRVLLRDVQVRDKKLKEIGVKLVDGSSEVWNKEDIRSKDNKTLFITEGVPDALSIKEVNNEVGAVALPGVRKYRQFLKELRDFPEAQKKKIVICFDNDEAGAEFANKFKKELRKMNVKYKLFDLGEYKDINEMLQANRTLLKMKVAAYNRSNERSFQFEKKKKEKNPDKKEVYASAFLAKAKLDANQSHHSFTSHKKNSASRMKKSKQFGFRKKVMG